MFFYISRVFSNFRSVFSQCNTRLCLRFLHLLYDTDFTRPEQIQQSTDRQTDAKFIPISNFGFEFWVDTGARHQEPATTPHSCHGVFTNRSIFSLNLSRIQIPTGTSATNCNHKHGLILVCRHVHVRPNCFIITKACSCKLELAYFGGQLYKNRLFCKNAVA